MSPVAVLRFLRRGIRAAASARILTTKQESHRFHRFPQMGSSVHDPHQVCDNLCNLWIIMFAQTTKSKASGMNDCARSLSHCLKTGAFARVFLV